MNINNPADKKSIQETLKQGTATEFWKLLVQALEQSIEHIKNEQNNAVMDDLPAEQYKTESVIMRSKIANLELLKVLPETISGWLDDPNLGGPEQNFDPYSKEKDFEKIK